MKDYSVLDELVPKTQELHRTIFDKGYEQGQKDILRKGEWLRMSDLSEKLDDRYKCSYCGNIVHHSNKMNLYTFNRWCGRCGSDNGRKSEDKEQQKTGKWIDENWHVLD